jgi:hypothetical protein
MDGLASGGLQVVLAAGTAVDFLLLIHDYLARLRHDGPPSVASHITF